MDDSNGPGTTATITLGAGEVDMSIYAGLYRCIPFGDRIWFDLNGNNRQDVNENGINGVRVDIFRRTNGNFALHSSIYSGHQPGTQSGDGYWKTCLPPGDYYVRFNVPSELRPAIPMVGGTTVDSDVTGAFGANTTNIFPLVSCTENCDVDAGYSSINGLMAGGGIPTYTLQEEVEFVASVSRKESYNELEWSYKNDSQVELSHFVISKIIDGEPVRIGQVIAEETDIFSFEDFDVLTPGLYNYTISAISKEDLELESREIEVEVLASALSIFAYPNPVRDILSLELTFTQRVEKLSLSILDNSGASVATSVLDFDIQVGVSRYDLDVSLVPAGIYYIQANADGNLTYEKIIVID